MTNKKLKLAAMSVALTACVAAQPMAAHAVEGPDSVEDNAAPQAEPAPVEGKTAEGEVEGEEEKQEEFVPPENDEAKKDDQAPAFGPGTNTDDIIIDYKPAEKPDESGESGETDETENPDGTYVKGDVIDNSKKDEATGKDGKIGEATKEETPDSSSSTTVVDPDAEVKKGDPVVGKDEDGNDIMQQQIDRNYSRIKADVLQIIEEEMARIANDPDLKHLIPQKEDDKKDE